MTVHCYFCNSRDIGERNVAVATLTVTNWDVDEFGNICPASYDTDVSVDWDCEDSAFPYACGSCGTRQALHSLVLRPETSAESQAHIDGYADKED